MDRYWTGVGSRDTPSRIEKIQISIGKRMAEDGLVLRSGNAFGSDYCFQKGVFEVDPSLAEIYLPWGNYNKELINLEARYLTLDESESINATEILEDSKVMPYIRKCKPGVQKMHLRNVYQVLGWQEERSEVCIYYAPLDNAGNVKGGTRTAVGVSKYYDIPCYNLFVKDELDAIMSILEL